MSDSELEPGLYEDLVTERLRTRLDELIALGRRIREERVDKAEQPHVLSRHLGGIVGQILELVDDNKRVEATNHLLALAGELAPGAADFIIRVADGPSQLFEVPAADTAGIVYRRPQIPLSRTDLLVNDRGEPALAHEIAAELSSADRVDLLCAFVKWTGLRLVADRIEDAVRRGVPVRVLTTTYIGATERRAVDELVRLGAEVRISYETQRTRLHAKAWLFRRSSGLHTAYIGSSNLSRSAMLDGLEWNVRVSRAENPSVIDKFVATFDSYWATDDFEPYDPAVDGERLDQALEQAYARTPLTLAGLEVRPFPFQQQILDALDAERHVHDRWRNLVVAATGTGKTVMGALDYRRLRSELGRDPTLLFVAHRKEILTQSLVTFANVMNDATFGELYVDGERPEQWRHVFASIQSLTAYGPEGLSPDHFDVVIIDEFHRAAAATYDALLSHLHPKVLLGLTATPERADGQSILPWFDGHIAAELRLWEALERELLCPFHYFGVADGTDLSNLEWRRGSYEISDLEDIYTGNDARVRLVLQELERRMDDVTTMRALGFCVSQKHAAFMAQRFKDAGIASVALDANTPSEQRADALRQLRDGNLQIIFAVDLFNEGLDIPHVDTVLFLRPTESATVFLQQLGRGLRHAPGKACLTVLDFIGQQHRRFRFDVRYRALTGVVRSALPKTIEEGFPFLPSGCHIELDRVATRTVLDNLKSQLRLNRKQLAHDLRTYGDVSLSTYLEESGRELADIYRSQGSFTTLRRSAGLLIPPPGESEDALLRRVHRFASVDDLERIRTWSDWLQAPQPPKLVDIAKRQQRLAAMLFFTFWPDGGGFSSLDDGLRQLWRHSAVRNEVVQLLELVGDRIAHVPLSVADPSFADAPLALHCHYSRDELLVGIGAAGLERTPTSDMQGVRFVGDLNADVFTFTLKKSERDYSPTTMYHDYVMSPDLVHWESQSTTSVDSPTGRRYLDGSSTVLLFARQTERDEIGTRSFLFLGPASHVSHEGSRPIAIVWRLGTPMPAGFYSETKVLAS